MTRCLPTNNIPTTLWHGDTLFLPVSLSSTYLHQLDRLGLRQWAAESGGSGIHGGQGKQETLEHFAKRFGTSAGRIEYSVLGPRDEFALISDAFLSTFSDGHVALLDIPCGTGAMTASLVSTLTDLRRAQMIPRLPLTISVCGGDVSQTALDILRPVMSGIASAASSQGITVRTELQLWDATQSDQTARLLDAWFKFASGATEHFVTVSNFSGALNSANAFAAFSPCFEQVLARLHDKLATIVWVEPATTGAKREILTRIYEFIGRRISWFVHDHQSDADTPVEASYQLLNSVTDVRFDSNVAVHRFIRQ